MVPPVVYGDAHAPVATGCRGPETAQRRVEIHAALGMFRPAADALLAAIDLHRLHGLSVWGALIVRPARESGCQVLHIEDLKHGRSVDGVVVLDPFRAA